jgi:hypothetical protein
MLIIQSASWRGRKPDYELLTRRLVIDTEETPKMVSMLY